MKKKVNDIHASLSDPSVCFTNAHFFVDEWVVEGRDDSVCRYF